MPSATARSARKRDAILEAAKLAFLRHGFAAANLDDIAAAAEVSKVTIYSHFNSKEKLFTSVLDWVIAGRSTGGPPLDPTVDVSELHDALTAIGVDLVQTALDPEVLALRRIMIAEQPRHPLFAELWRRTTVVAATDSLIDYFAAMQRRGTIAVPMDAYRRSDRLRAPIRCLAPSGGASYRGGCGHDDCSCIRNAKGVARVAASRVITQ